MEASGANRAQLSEIQEFADYFTEGGIGPYPGQVEVVDLLSIKDTLKGFDGIFQVIVSNNQESYDSSNVYNSSYSIDPVTYYAVLVPYHNFESYFGEVVIVNLNLLDTSYKNVETIINSDCVNSVEYQVCVDVCTSVYYFYVYDLIYTNAHII